MVIGELSNSHSDKLRIGIYERREMIGAAANQAKSEGGGTRLYKAVIPLWGNVLHIVILFVVFILIFFFFFFFFYLFTE